MATKTCCHGLLILQAPAECREWRGAGLGVTERTRLLPARSQGQTGLVHRHGRAAPCWWILVLNGNTRQFQVTWKILTLELSSWGALWTIVPTPIRFLEIHVFAFTAFYTSKLCIIKRAKGPFPPNPITAIITSSSAAALLSLKVPSSGPQA